MIRRGLPEAYVPHSSCYMRRALSSSIVFTPAHVDVALPPVEASAWSGTFVLDGSIHIDPQAALCAAGPVSNTGLTGHLGEGKGESAFAVSIDYLTLVFPDDGAKDQGQATRTILSFLFGTSRLMATELRSKSWQFYRLSSFIHDEEGNTVGRIGRGGNGDTWCVSLSGAGCRLVSDWARVVGQAAALRAHISRIDVAFDDYAGAVFDIRGVDAMARSGAFAGNGQPPRTRFIDDHGSNTGCTVYVGGKGRKELCIYEKGKQLGDPESPWVRVELRLWSRNCVIPMEAITFPERFLRGAYKVLDERLPIVASPEAARPEYTRREVDATVQGAKRFLKQQCGPLLHLLWAALGPGAEDWFKENVFRNTVPARFKGKGGDRESLLTLLREEMGYAFVAPF
ncbi:replication initiation factor domain-containing protein [Luteibacter flocculans]|uniref:Replication initiation factor domain-containing protein n=1 Tax=Luteibacter flocculans TaxID=2780091 RepID=A0ABY4T5K6_9GAMM|nr:replication initiation factor domain-containing protein [Luteibacter flocculans]URL60173.1 replication initiation factor domain-containing protein [Luteibacter flocculans]